MAKKKASPKNIKSFEESLWDSANKLRGSVESSERAQPKQIAEICVTDCGESLRKEYVKATIPCFRLLRNNLLQMQSLTKLRDTLLPKLISGEIRIPNAEKLDEEALV
jgi:type I restriction enzyme, S subunit